MKKISLLILFIVPSIIYAQKKPIKVIQNNGGGNETTYVVDGKTIPTDSLAKISVNDIKSIKIATDSETLKKYEAPLFGSVIEIELKNGSSPVEFSLNERKNDPLVIVDGMESKVQLDKINPNLIRSIEVIKGADAVNRYGDKGKNGVLVVQTNKVKTIEQ